MPESNPTSGDPDPPNGTERLLDRALFEHVASVVQEARREYRRYLEEGKWVPRIHRFPVFDTFDSGFPHIKTASDADSPFEHDRIFGLREGRFTPISFAEWPSFIDLVTLAKTHDRLLTSYFTVPFTEEEPRHQFFLIETSMIPFGIFDRVMHLHGIEFTDDDLLSVYREVEMGLLAENLPFAILVPITLTHFEATEMTEIVPSLYLAPLPEDWQLARWRDWPNPASSTNEIVNMAATHALIIEGWSMPNQNRNAQGWDRLNWYPVATIDRFLDALRVTTGLDTGFAEIAVKPIGWANSYRAGLPSMINGPQVRSYPTHFDNFGWLAERSAVTNEELAEVVEVYRCLDSGRPNLALAATRLGTGMLREREEDTILDLVIGLEALFGDSGVTELTHKLALRVATVLATGRDPADPVETFNTVKHLYAFRSAVAHGNSDKIGRLRTVRQPDGDTLSVHAARDLLRKSIGNACKDEEVLDPKAIDRRLLGALRPDA